jgi:hypothetical protein
MYDWKDIALQYKDEISHLRDEVYESFFTLSDNCPGSYKRAISILENSIVKSDQNVNFIENFEVNADKSVKKDIDGGFIKGVNLLSEENYLKIKKMCEENFQDKDLPYVFPDKIALSCTYDYLKSKGFELLAFNLLKNKENVISAIDSVTGMESRIKVVSSSMKFMGKTSKLNGKRDIEVSSQHTYLINPKEIVKERYFFANFSNKDRSLKLYAWVKGKKLREMLVFPLRERFLDKKVCVLERDGVSKGLPLSIRDVAKRT